MKAIIYKNYGSPEQLSLQEVTKPQPKTNEVLIKVTATSINAADWRLLRADPFLVRFFAGLFKPKFPILGSDVAGIVEAVGRQITQFKVGDRVCADLSGTGFGGLAEYVCTTEAALAQIPSEVSLEEAAGIPLAGITALQAIRELGTVNPGDTMLINGAAGGIGCFVVQLAKAKGAIVTAVCSTQNVAQTKALGADQVIDYSKEDFTKMGLTYDFILGVNGYQPLAAYKHCLKPNGKYLMVGGAKAQLFEALLKGPFYSMRSTQKFNALTLKKATQQSDLVALLNLVNGKKLKVIIEKKYPLGEAVEAFRYLEKGHAKGKLLITQENS